MNSLSNLVWNYNLFPESGLADPHAIVEGDRVYLFCGHDQSWYTDHTWVMDKWVIISSDNLTDWRVEGEILPTDTYIGDQPKCWAGFITKKDNKFYWYFSNQHIDTGVMVSNSPCGPFQDALGHAVLPEGIVPGIQSYDPCVYEEDGIYTLIFGSGDYYAVQLGDDMTSLVGEPKRLNVVNEDGSRHVTDDKNTLFKYKDKYYLAWGNNYAMSDELFGTYIFKGPFIYGHHNSFFIWKGQPYIAHEHPDTSHMFRGVAVKPLLFNDDGTVDCDTSNGSISYGNCWNFDSTTMGWKSRLGPALTYSDQSINGVIDETINGDVLIQSATWLKAELYKCRTLSIEIKNHTDATRAEILLAPIDYSTPNVWSHPEIDVTKLKAISFDLKSDSSTYQRFEFDLSEFEDTQLSLKSLFIKPALGASRGNWSIRHIEVK